MTLFSTSTSLTGQWNEWACSHPKILDWCKIQSTSFVKLRQQLTVSILWSLVSRKLGIKGLAMAICINLIMLFISKFLGILEYLHRFWIIIEQANFIIQQEGSLAQYRYLFYLYDLIWFLSKSKNPLQQTSVDPYLKRFIYKISVDIDSDKKFHAGTWILGSRL